MDGSVWTQCFGAARSSADVGRPVSLAVQQGSTHLDRIPMLIRGLRHAGLCVMYQDRTLAVRMVENPFDSWPAAATILAMGDRAIFDPDTAEQVIGAKQRACSTPACPSGSRPGCAAGHEDCWYALNIEPDVGARGAVRGLFVTASDITEIKRREETLKSLLSEVSHRSRNLLAIVQSILAHTARLESDPADFAAKFRGRIHSLALTQDIVTQANWRGAAFRHLVAAQLEPLASTAAKGHRRHRPRRPARADRRPARRPRDPRTRDQLGDLRRAAERPRQHRHRDGGRRLRPALLLGRAPRRTRHAARSAAFRQRGAEPGPAPGGARHRAARRRRDRRALHPRPAEGGTHLIT
jgi:hypothetical protein